MAVIIYLNLAPECERPNFSFRKSPANFVSYLPPKSTLFAITMATHLTKSLVQGLPWLHSG